MAVISSLVAAMAGIGTALGASAATAAGVGTAVTLGTLGVVGGVGAAIGTAASKSASGGGGGGGGSTTASVPALTMAQLQAGNSNISNTMSGYTSNTLNTARGRLLNV